MRYFPLFHDTQDLRVLVVGGGEVAARKLSLWARTQASLTVISPTLVPSIQALVAEGRVVHQNGFFHRELLRGFGGVIAATNDPHLNRDVARQAREAGAWVNVVDDPAACSVITPALVDRSPILVAIGSEGTAPVLVRMLRAWLESSLPRSLGRLAQFIGGERLRVQKQHDDPRGVWERFLQANGLSWQSDSVEHLAAAERATISAGKLYLIDPQQQPGLLPIDALPLLQQIDRLLFIRRPDAQLRDYCRRDASEHQVSLAQVAEVRRWLAEGEKLLLVVGEAEGAIWQRELNSVCVARFSSGRMELFDATVE
ncbi:bifunctional precorrin-2 dehydrogenase/sirohydrochlorin ferrochelatase [Ferrimonas gelatinilytica]|uniref:precorrin-2 dehydrogenase n=1 Tax=Ferrimonas gelatinilytica TaxID=1255257 RepID=A0ABP9S6D1_9GAMM